MTKDIDEMAELKKGNVAIAIILVSLLLSIATIVGKGVYQFEEIFSQPLSPQMFVIALIMAVLRIIVLILITVLAIFTAIKVIDTMTVEINELREIKRGNVAIALILAAVIYVIAFIVSNALMGIEELAIFKHETLASLLHIS
jgi:uncharacterized membrane protein YjfL (UPF0719 family)